jgi:hypothetical protein
MHCVCKHRILPCTYVKLLCANLKHKKRTKSTSGSCFSTPAVLWLYIWCQESNSLSQCLQVALLTLSCQATLGAHPLHASFVIWFILQLHCLQPSWRLQCLLSFFWVFFYLAKPFLLLPVRICLQKKRQCLCFAGFDEQLSFLPHMELMWQLANKCLSRTHCIQDTARGAGRREWSKQRLPLS